MQSDILMLSKQLLDETSLRTIKGCLMDVHKTVLVHQNDKQNRMLLVKFDPREVRPKDLLDAAQNAGFDVSVAGG